MLDALKALLKPSDRNAGRKTNTTKQLRGDAAESLAESFLVLQGLNLVQRNFSCRFGEIDLIMEHQQSLVFVEVRLRKALEMPVNRAFPDCSQRTIHDYGGAIESVSPAKQRKIIRAAQFYLTTLAYEPPCRFDVVALDKLDAANIEWLRNAFDASA